MLEDQDRAFIQAFKNLHRAVDGRAVLMGRVHDAYVSDGDGGSNILRVAQKARESEKKVDDRLRVIVSLCPPELLTEIEHLCSKISEWNAGPMAPENSSPRRITRKTQDWVVEFQLIRRQFEQVRAAVARHYATARQATGESADSAPSVKASAPSVHCGGRIKLYDGLQVVELDGIQHKVNERLDYLIAKHVIGADGVEVSQADVIYALKLHGRTRLTRNLDRLPKALQSLIGRRGRFHAMRLTLPDRPPGKGRAPKKGR